MLVLYIYVTENKGTLRLNMCKMHLCISSVGWGYWCWPGCQCTNHI